MTILAGCGSGASDGQDADHAGADVSPSAQPTTALPSPADPEAADKAKVLEAYRGMTQAEAEAYRTGSEKGTGLERYATLDALGQTRLDLARMKEAGTVVRGEVGHEPKVTSLDLAAETPKATLSDCIDLSKYQTYDVRAKKVIPLPSEQPLRYVATATAERWDGRWMITKVDTQGGGEC
ncbi:hypothetical protein ACFQMH_41610 [Streptomyces viridiviolaceus]|uniref:Secreted protein/lipoprotein n=1 Tax=Streptomyces viridiviolaceus TaxID=68282 RepID=A0ABW2ED60_9ACTN|nr:hypothetical protein [Streptomyces viridiviolaceus]